MTHDRRFRSPGIRTVEVPGGGLPGKRTLTQGMGAHRVVQAKPMPSGVQEPPASSSSASAETDDPFGLHLPQDGVKSDAGAPPDATAFQSGPPGTPISHEDVQALQAHARHSVRVGHERDRGHIIFDGANPTTYDYDTYVGDWHHAGGTGEPPRYGFYNVQGRAQLWGRAQPPHEYHLQRLAAPRAVGIVLPEPSVDVDVDAPTGIDVNGPTGVANNAAHSPAPAAAPPRPDPSVRLLRNGPPGTPISHADVQQLEAYERYSEWLGRQDNSAETIHLGFNPTTYDYVTYAADWRSSGGTGEPPRYGFYNRHGRAQIWGQAEAPHDFHVRVSNEPRATVVELPRPRPGRTAASASVDPLAATGVDAHAATLHGGLHPHGPRAAAIESPTGPIEVGGSRVLRGVGHVGGAAAGAYGAYEGVREMQHAAELARRGNTGEAISHGTEGALDAASGGMAAVGEVGALVGAESAAAAGTAALPLAAAAGAIAADRAGDEHARNTGALGRRQGVAGGRGTQPRLDGGPTPEANQDFGDVAESAGHAVERRTGSVVAGAVATSAARVHLLPLAATYGVRQTLGDSGGRSDTTDLEAQDQEQRGAPLAEASPAVRAARERLRAQHREHAAAQAVATEQAHRARDAQTAVTAHRQGMPITETDVNQRAMSVMREWMLQGAVDLLDLDLMERARHVAREQLELERAGIH